MISQARQCQAKAMAEFAEYIRKDKEAVRQAGMHDKLQQCSHGRHGQQDKGDKEGNVQQGTGEAAKSKTDIWRE